jgi:HSP20 family protein
MIMPLLRRHETGAWPTVLNELDEMRRRMESLFGNGGVFAHADWTPSADISETDTEYRVHAALPDVKKEDVKVTLENGMLTLRGERKARKEEKNEKIHRVEIEQGSFYRTFSMPSDADPEKITAHFHDGTLDISVGKTPAKKSGAKTINVQ